MLLVLGLRQPDSAAQGVLLAGVRAARLRDGGGSVQGEGPIMSQRTKAGESEEGT